MVLFSSKVGLYCGAVDEINQPLFPIGMKTPIFIAHLNLNHLNKGLRKSQRGLSASCGFQIAPCGNSLTSTSLQRGCQFLNNVIYHLVKNRESVGMERTV